MAAARQQLDRVKRLLERIERRDVTDDGRDDLDNFFIHCWALKDHIKNDPLLQIARPVVENDVSGYRSLMIAADIANRTKHLTLTNARRDAEITHKYIQAYDGLGSSSQLPTTARYGITLDDGSLHDALDIARQAVVDWETILRVYGL